MRVAYSRQDQRCTDLAVDERDVDDFDVQAPVELPPKVEQVVETRLGPDVGLDELLPPRLDNERRRPDERHPVDFA